MRNELVMHLAPPSATRIRSIVDELFLPRVAAGGGERAVTTA
jgi:hypothetical protein